MTHEDLLKAIGKNIKEARIEKQMIGYTLGKALGVDKGYISQMEHGKVDFKISQLFRIAEILEADVCKFLAHTFIKSAEEINNIPPDQHEILIYRKVIDDLILQLKRKEKILHK